MTETTTPTEQVFGFETAPLLDAYRTAIRTADRVLSETRSTIDSPLMAAKAAVRNLLPGQYDVARNLASLLDTLSAPARNEERDVAEELHATAVDAARKEFHGALAKDPFTAFIDTRIRYDYGDSYAEAFFEALPLTYEGLRNLADAECWCLDFEREMNLAVKRGALPGDTVTVIRSVRDIDVPVDEHDGHGGGTWEARFQVHPFVRLTDRNDDPRGFIGLKEFAVGKITYSRVSKDPES